MTFPEFLGKHYREEPGRAVSLKSILRAFYESDSLASFDYPPDAIRRYLESKHPVGTFNREAHCGNLAGDDSVLVCERDLVVCEGELLPRYLTRDEMEMVGRATRHVNKRQVTTLTRNERSSRGWDKRTLSRAQWLATQKTE